MLKKLKKNPLMRTLLELRGNPRACVYTEPMWGLSMNLCLPYASVYMLAFGMNDIEVGIVSSIYMFSQVISSILAGPMVDKLGRRWSTVVADFLAWSIPCLIWAFSQGFWFFVGAALLNGIQRVSAVSWDCLLVEDAPKDKITHIYSWVTIAGNMSALFAPISSILVAKLTMVSAVKILYINAFVIMTLKIAILAYFSTETAPGKVRREATKDMSLKEMLSGYTGSFAKIRGSRGMKFAIVISILVEIIMSIGSTFWQIIVSKRIGVPDVLLPIFPMFKSVLSMILILTVLTRMRQDRLKFPLYGGFLCMILADLILILIEKPGVYGYILLIASLSFEALGAAVLNTLRESLVAINADPEDRSNVMALLQAAVMLVSVPFGYIAGVLSDCSRVLPFVLCIVLLFTGMLCTAIFYKEPKKING